MGKVLRLSVEAGAEVARGDEVMVVESMKVEIPIKAPAAGRVYGMGTPPLKPPPIMTMPPPTGDPADACGFLPYCRRSLPLATSHSRNASSPAAAPADRAVPPRHLPQRAGLKQCCRAASSASIPAAPLPT